MKHKLQAAAIQTAYALAGMAAAYILGQIIKLCYYAGFQM